MNIILFDASEIISDSISLKKHMNIKNTKNGEPIGGTLEFLSIIRDVCNRFDGYPVIVWDGGVNRLRSKLDPSYKSYNPYFSESRALCPDSDAPEHENYLRQKEICTDILYNCECIQFFFPNIEREELLSYISEGSNNYIIVSDDDDLAQLLKHNVSLYRPFEDTYVQYDSYKTNFEIEDISKLVINKGVTGDYLDMVKGCCAGVGDMYAESLLKLANILDNNFDHPVEYLKEVCSKNDIPFRSAYVNFSKDKFKRNINLYKLRPAKYIGSDITSDIDMTMGMITEDMAHEHDIVSTLFSVVDSTSYIDLDKLKEYRISYRYSC